MRRLYAIVPGPALSVHLVKELLAEGAAPQSIHLFTREPGQLTDLPVSVTGFRPPRDMILLRTLSGAILALLTALLVITVSGVGGSPVLLLLTVTLAGAAIGAVSTMWRGASRELHRLQGELREDDVVMVMDLPEARLGEMERKVKSRHPEIRVKGTDPAGSPPFP
jgi:hypothetical protein